MAAIGDLYGQIHQLTHAACLTCPNEAGRLPYRCCDAQACDNATKWMRLKGIDPEQFQTGHPTLDYMGPSGCVLPLENKPLCTMHQCMSDIRISELRTQIAKLEGEDWTRYLSSL